jgi:hypothetical protein
MHPEPSASFLSSIDVLQDAGDEVPTPRLTRIGLAAWAALVYLVYWLGYLGVLGGR